MKNLIRLSLLFILPLFIACNSGAEKAADTEGKNDQTSIQDIKKEMSDVKVETGNYLSQEYLEMVKEVKAYSMSTEAELNEMSEDLDEEYEEQRSEVLALQDSLNMYIKEVQQEGAEDVDIIVEKIKKTRSALEKSMETFEEAMKKEDKNKKNK
jgi:F0F1-type ATP synthase membrane subunit b/b'